MQEEANMTLRDKMIQSASSQPNIQDLMARKQVLSKLQIRKNKLRDKMDLPPDHLDISLRNNFLYGFTEEDFKDVKNPLVRHTFTLANATPR